LHPGQTPRDFVVKYLSPKYIAFTLWLGIIGVGFPAAERIFAHRSEEVL